MSINDTQGISTAPAEEESLVIKFGKPYKFEGKEYTEVDLSGLENLSAEDMISADKYLSKNGSFSVVPEMALEYACFTAAQCSDQPIEFFRRLPAKEAIKVKNKVTGFFYGED